MSLCQAVHGRCIGVMQSGYAWSGKIKQIRSQVFTSSGMASLYFDRGKMLNQLAVHFDTILFYKKLYFCCNSPFNIVNQFITLKIVIFCLELVFFPSERWFENGKPNTHARLDFPKRDSALQFPFITLKYVNLFLQALNSFANG